MRTQTYKIMSQSCLVAGSLSIAGSLGLWLAGRIQGNRRMQHDSLFVGLWVPSFFVLADRLATAALTHQQTQRSLAAGIDEIPETAEAIEAAEQCGPVQSPRPLQHVAPR